MRMKEAGRTHITELPVNLSRLKNTLWEMIDIYSPSGKEGELVDFLEEYFREAGMPVVSQEVEEDRRNLLILPEDKKARLVFVGHTDTVSAFDYENYRSAEKGDEIIGLGSADMKSGCAAMIEAFTTCWKEGHRGVPAALALVVGEEETGDGTEALLEEYHFPWAIVGEPTNLVPCLSHYGYIEGRLKTRGKRVHASLADSSHNAIRSMLSILLRLTTHLDKSRNEIIYNIRDVNSSEAGFAVPDSCEAWVDLHLPPGYSTGEMALELEELISGFPSDNLSPQDILTFSTIHAGYELPDRGFLPGILRKLYEKHGLPWNPGAFRSHSDANILWEAGIKPVILGPGQLERAHTQDESVSFGQVARASGIYLDTLLAIDT